MAQAKIFEKPSASVMATVTTDDAGKVTVKFGKGRGPSNIGGDGSHTSSYLLFYKIAKNLCQKEKPEIAIKNMLALIDSYVKGDTPQQVFEYYKERVAVDLHSDEKMDEIYQYNLAGFGEAIASQILEGLKLHETARFEIFLKHLLELHVTLRNKLEGTTYPAEGNLPQTSDEGTRAKMAVAFLESLPTLIYQDENMQVEREEEKGDKAEGKDDTVIAAELSVHKDEILKAMQNLFWHPKIPPGILIDLDTPEGIEKWEKASKYENGKNKYKIGTKPRSNGIEPLADAIVTHLDLIFTFCPKLGLIREDLITAFIESVLNDSKENAVNYGWNLGKGNEYLEAQQEINRKIKKLDHLNRTFKERDSNSSCESRETTLSLTGSLREAGSPMGSLNVSNIPGSPIFPNMEGGSDSEGSQDRTVDHPEDFYTSSPPSVKTSNIATRSQTQGAGLFDEENRKAAATKRKKPETQDNKDESQSQKRTNVQPDQPGGPG